MEKKRLITGRRLVEVKRRTFEIKPFTDSFSLPVRAKKGSIGYDLTVPKNTLIPAHSRCLIPLGFAINLPNGVEAKIEPRSGLSITGMIGYGIRKVSRKLLGFIPWFSRKVYGKWHFDADVIVGKIDPNYTDEVNVIVKNNDVQFTIEAGTRIAQMSFYNVGSPFFKVVDKLTCNSRGGGLGSSGTSAISKDVDSVKVRPFLFGGLAHDGGAEYERYVRMMRERGEEPIPHPSVQTWQNILKKESESKPEELDPAVQHQPDSQ